MVAEVARGGEEGRPAILVAAVAGNAGGLREGGVDARTILLVEGEGEQAQIVGPVLALAEPRADDHGGDRRLLQDPAGRDVGDRDAVAAGHLGQRGQDGLQHGPAADRVDEALVLHLAPVADRGGLGLADPAVAEEAAGQRAVGEEPDPALEAEPAHLLAGAPVQEREADLVGHDRKAVHDQQPQMVGVEIGHAQMGDAALALELRPARAWRRDSPGGGTATSGAAAGRCARRPGAPGCGRRLREPRRASCRRARGTIWSIPPGVVALAGMVSIRPAISSALP